MMDLLDYLLYLGPTLGPLILALVFRKRIGRAFARLMLAGTPEFIEEFLWEEAERVIEGKKVKVKVLRKAVADQLEALAPALVVPILKSINIRLPKNLPINAAGQIDFMAPLAMKLMEGKKVSAMDFVGPFVPMLAEVGQVVGGKFQEVVSGFVNKGLPSKAAKAATALTPEAQAIVNKAMNP